MEEGGALGSSVASERWKLLRRSILAAKHTPVSRDAHSTTDPCSVRRFSSFNLFHVTELASRDLHTAQGGDQTGAWSKDSIPAGKWYKYEQYGNIDCAVAITYITQRTSLEDMIGFNNTGNVCLWPAEEVLAYYCLKHVDRFRGTAVCELGCGMTGLAGVFLAATEQLAQVLLTDGNHTSVDNMKEILRENDVKFGSTATSAEVLVWSSEFISSASPHHSKFDYVICADCLFFEDAHHDLAQVILKLLKPNGKALIFAPRRSGTLETFCSVAKECFVVDVTVQYDEAIWERHQALKDNGIYSMDLHYPLCLTLQPIPVQPWS